METISQELKDKVDMLEDTLKHDLPAYRVHLNDINKLIREDPEQVTILSDTEMKQILQGLGRLRDITITTSKSTNRSKLSAKNTTPDEF